MVNGHQSAADGGTGKMYLGRGMLCSSVSGYILCISLLLISC